MHVEVLQLTKAVDIQDHYVEVESAGRRTRIATETVIWAAGVKASPLGARLATACGATIDRAGAFLYCPIFRYPVIQM